MQRYGFRVILKDIFAPGDLDTVMKQLVFRSQGDLEQFVETTNAVEGMSGEMHMWNLPANLFFIILG